MTREYLFHGWLCGVGAVIATAGLLALIFWAAGSLPWSANTSGPASAKVMIPESVMLAPGEKMQLPKITLGVFQGNFDDLMQRLYDWQYEYLWNYTRDDYYAKMEWDSAWYDDEHNLQENFAGGWGNWTWIFRI